MSKFITKIPINVEEVVAMLPKRSDVESVSLSEDGKTIELLWGNDWMKTPFTFPLEWDIAHLIAKTEPEKVVGNQPVTPHPPIEPKKDVDNFGRVKDKKGK